METMDLLFKLMTLSSMLGAIGKYIGISKQVIAILTKISTVGAVFACAYSVYSGHFFILVIAGVTYFVLRKVLHFKKRDSNLGTSLAVLFFFLSFVK